jgi:hypothetical protein
VKCLKATTPSTECLPKGNPPEDLDHHSTRLEPYRVDEEEKSCLASGGFIGLDTTAARLPTQTASHYPIGKSDVVVIDDAGWISH